MKINIHCVDKYASEKRAYGVEPDVSAREAFRNLTDENPTNNAYSWAMGSLDATLSWIFYEWHRSHSLNLIRSTVGQVVDRVHEVNRLASNQGLRRLHDIFLLQAAILSGSKAIMREAASLAGGYDGMIEHAYPWGLVELYKRAILDDDAGIKSAFELMMKSRPSPPYRMPLKSVVTDFVLKEQKKFAQTLQRVWTREWKLLEVRQRGVINRTDECIIVSLRERGANDLWPWPEVAFAKLAILRDWKIPNDCLWCPEEFVTSFCD